MKTLLLLVSLLIDTGLTRLSVAQVNVSVNISSQPVWGPTGYDYVNYYYLPDLDIYYYVPAQEWIYFEGGRWITTTVLPPRYNSYDLYRVHKVVINDKQPYLRNAAYQKQYASFKGRYDQQPIRDSRDAKYTVAKSRPTPGKAPTVNQRPVGGQPKRQDRPQRSQGPQAGSRSQPGGPRSPRQ